MGKTEKYSVHKRLVYRTKETRSSNVRDTRSEEYSLLLILIVGKIIKNGYSTRTIDIDTIRSTLYCTVPRNSIYSYKYTSWELSQVRLMRAATGRHPITATGGINNGFKRGDALATSYWYSFVFILNSN